MYSCIRTEIVSYEEVNADELIKQLQYPENEIKTEKQLNRKEWKEQQAEKTRHFLSRKRG